MLSNNPGLAALDGRQYQYLALSNRQWMLDTQLTRAAHRSVFGYVNASLLLSDETILARGCAAARQLIEAGQNPILSAQRWIDTAEQMSRSRFLERVGAPAKVALFLRSPAEFLNSAWWQWGCWTGEDRDTWIEKRIASTDWAARIAAWQAVPGVDSLQVYVLDRDAIARFFGDLGVGEIRVPRLNGTISADMLDFLRKHSRYRDGPHAPHTEFAVARWATFTGPPPPWALSEELMQHVLETTRPSVDALLQLVGEETAERIISDPRWWRVDAFADRLHASVEPPDMKRLNRDLTGAFRSMAAQEKLRYGIGALARDSFAPSAPIDTRNCRLLDAILAADSRWRWRDHMSR